MKHNDREKITHSNACLNTISHLKKNSETQMHPEETNIIENLACN